MTEELQEELNPKPKAEDLAKELLHRGRIGFFDFLRILGPYDEAEKMRLVQGFLKR